MSTVAVDPRIRQRRVTLARDAGRRRLRRVMIGGVALVVGLVALGLTLTPALDVEQVEVGGAGPTSGEGVTGGARRARHLARGRPRGGGRGPG